MLVLDPGVLDEADLADWSARGTGEALASLESLGFDRVARLANMSVWRRTPSE